MKGLKEEDGYLALGTIAILWTFLLAVLVSVPTLVVIYRARIVSFFKRKK